MSNRIVIDEEYEIDFDGIRCYTLIQKKVITGEGRGAHLLKDKGSIGKTRELELGFYGTFAQCLGAYTDKCVGNKAQNLDGVVAVLKECQERVSQVASLPKNMALASSNV